MTELYNIKAGQILNLFADTELNQIRTLCNILSQSPKTTDDNSMFYVNGFRPSDRIYPAIQKLVLEPLNRYFQRRLYLDHGMLLNSKQPFGIHTDYNKGDTNPDMAILVPLHPTDLDKTYTSTVVFNEECLDSFEEYAKINESKTPNCIDLRTSLLSHESEENLSKVSLYDIYNWHHGSAIYWNRKLLHSSDNYLANDLEGKTALILFTTFL